MAQENRPMKIKRVRNRPIESKRVRNRPIKCRAAEAKRKKCQETSENPKARTVQRERERERDWESARTACACLRCCRVRKEREREREISNTTVLVLVLQSLFVSFFAFLVSERRIITIALLVCFVLFVVSKSSSNSREEAEVAGDGCVTDWPTDRPTDSYSSRHKKSSSFEDFVCSFAAFWKTFYEKKKKLPLLWLFLCSVVQGLKLRTSVCSETCLEFCCDWFSVKSLALF
jgi:hypothetical protein